jgi:hypothetical protein
MSDLEHNDERWEQAVAGRLSKLRTMPVDTGRLAAALEDEIPRPQRAARTAWFSLRPVGAAAATILLAGALAVILVVATAGRPALALPAHMARMHEELVSGKVPAVQVDSIEAANAVLAGQHPECPQVPEVPAEHVMACCMKSVKDKKVACVLLKREGVPVSMMVARSGDMRAPTSPVTVRDGIRYHVQASGALNMVMAEREGKWVCLIGELPAERLIDLATQIKF